MGLLERVNSLESEQSAWRQHQYNQYQSNAELATSSFDCVHLQSYNPSIMQSSANTVTKVGNSSELSKRNQDLVSSVSNLSNHSNNLNKNSTSESSKKSRHL